MSLKDRLNAIPKWIYLTVSIVLIISMVVSLFLMNRNKFEEISHKSLSFVNSAYDKNVELTKASSSDSLSTEQVDILLKKIAVIEQNKLHHIDSLKMLSKNNYALLTLLPFMSAITAVLIFLIIQKGWNETDDYLKTYFILFTVLTSLIGIYPEVYDQSNNIEKHMESYINYKKIQKTIFNYSLTAPVIEKDTLRFNQFINEVNTKEKELINLIFSIEKKSLEKDIFDSEIK